MRPAAIITGLAGIGIVAGLIVAGGQRLGTPDAGDMGSADILDVETTVSVAPPTTNPQSSMNARPIDAASQFYPAAVDGKPLERIATPAPVEAPKAAAEKGVDLPRPVAESAGVLSIGGRKLQLAGITPTPDDKACAGNGGATWPCGMLAKTNFRLFLRLRTINCDLDRGEWTGTATAACRIGTQDISQWLVENGWATAAAGSALADASKQAEAARRGIFGDDPRRLASDGVTEQAPVEDLSDPL
ncbi:thermonuclease family protein [Rhizobium sp. S152]|uniref:thermonuclease family protein n=1 Tax=Rhizobium sp. S152 TaxID=3055038 RepID=UPI0025AA03C4|nr:thermonuclease family protein [Rhizobium sp. S152]MDM9626301.1 thermonuclease family protein [Rhizobium sp. S152]